MHFHFHFHCHFPFRFTPLSLYHFVVSFSLSFLRSTKVQEDLNRVMFAFTKIGHYVQNPPEEIYVMSSTTLLTAEDPLSVTWTMLPENQDHGVTCPAGYNCNTTVMEEGHVLPLSTVQNRTVIMGRTSMGYLASVTRDENIQKIHSDDDTGIAQYWNNTVSGSSQQRMIPLHSVVAENGKPLLTGVKHPRGPYTPKEIMPGVWLLLYYNNNGGGWYGRDPYFLACGREVVIDNEATILWSQPEIVLYDSEYRGGTSGGGYPDLIFVDSSSSNSSNNSNSNSNSSSTLFTHEPEKQLHVQQKQKQTPVTIPDVYITTAQKGLPHPAKSKSYVLQVDRKLIHNVLTQHLSSCLPVDITPILILDTAKDMNMNQILPSLPATGTLPTVSQQGFTMVFSLQDHALSHPGDVIITHDSLQLSVGGGSTNTSSLHFNFSYWDGRGSVCVSKTNAMCTGLLVAPGTHHVAVVADGGANIVSYVVDGIYCDGSWSWIPPTGMRDVPASSKFQVHSRTQKYGGEIFKMKVYDRALMTSEIVALYRRSLKE